MNTTKDKIFIKNLEINCVVGANPGEKDQPQRLQFDIEIPVDCSRAAGEDDLKDTVDYWKVSCRLKQLAAQTSFRLIESLADHLASKLAEEFNLPEIKLTIKKPGAFKTAAYSGVTVTRPQ
jgi:dihydroneopterin aldolase